MNSARGTRPKPSTHALEKAFFLDDQIRRRTRLDAIVTVVDLRHIVSHWHTLAAVQQIVFGDVLLLNKTDLVSEAELFAVRDRIRRMNPLAKLHVTQHCELPLEAVLDLQAFDLSRALAIDGQLLRERRAAWAGHRQRACHFPRNRCLAPTYLETLAPVRLCPPCPVSAEWAGLVRSRSVRTC